MANSEAALLMSPEVYGMGGVYNTDTAVSTNTALPGGTVGRLTAGLRYSLSGLYRGVTLRDRAREECLRYRSESELHAFLAANPDGESKRALTAQRVVLEAALPQARELLERTRVRMAEQTSTVVELTALERREHELRTLWLKLGAEIDARSSLPTPPTKPVSQALAERDRAETRVQGLDARLRAIGAWDLSLRGGYDQLLTGERRHPLFGLVMLSYNLGGLFQGGSEDRAEAGRRVFVREQIEGVDDRITRLTARLRATQRGEQERLEETRRMVERLQKRFDALRAVTAERAQDYADQIWFDLVLARAEEAYLVAHLQDIAEILDGQRADAPH
jgi:hypothetical protein